MPHQSYKTGSRHGVTPGLGLCMLTNLFAKGTNEYANKFLAGIKTLIGSVHAWEGRDENEALLGGKTAPFN